jgi:hypothetical protein
LSNSATPTAVPTRAVADRRERQDATIRQPLALVETLDDAAAPVPDAAIGRADPHVAGCARQRRDGDAGQLGVRGCELPSVVKEQPARRGAEQQASRAEHERRGQLSIFRSIGPHLRDATAVEGEEAFAIRVDQKLRLRRREHADREADDGRRRKVEAGAKSPDETAVQLILDEPLRSRDEQVAAKHRGVAKDRRRSDGVHPGGRWTIECPDGDMNAGLGFGAGARLTDRVRRFPREQDSEERDERAECGRRSAPVEMKAPGEFQRLSVPSHDIGMLRLSRQVGASIAGES